jgi:hypothetical protein
MSTLSLIADICSIVSLVLSGVALTFIYQIKININARDITDKSVKQTAVGSGIRQIGNDNG